MLKLHNVTKIYENGTVALKDVSLEFPAKGFIAVVGASGSGKSTLLNILTANDSVTSGNVYFDGEDYLNLTRNRISNEFSYVYQDYKLIEHLSVADNIRIGYELSGRNSDFNIDDLLEKVKIGDCGKESVTNLSGGQKQRVAIARALIRDPKVLVADEPTGNLDKVNSNNVFELLKEVSKERLVIVVTHDTDLAEKYCNRIIKLDYGEIEYDNVISEMVEICKKGEYISKKSEISSASTLALAKSFNKGKKALKIINITLSIIMTVALVLMMGLAMLKEEDAIYYNMRKNGGNAFAVTCEKKDNESRRELPLDKLKEKLDGEKIPNAFIYKSIDNFASYNIVPNIGDEYVIQNRPVTLVEKVLMNLDKSKYVIATNDIENIGIKIIDGRAPNGKDEIIISKTQANFMLEVKNHAWYKDRGDGEYETEYIAYNSYNDIYAKPTLYGNLKVVGVFEDHFDVNKIKYNKIAANPKEFYNGKNVNIEGIKFYEKQKLSQLFFDTYNALEIFFIQSVIVGEDAVEHTRIEEGNKKLFIDGRKLSPNEIKNIYDWCSLTYGLDNALDMDSTGYVMFEYDYSGELRGAVQNIRFYGEYLFIPILIFVILVIALLALNHYIVTVKYNASDILILKSLGAKKFDILKVFAINAGVLLLFDLVIGIALGIGLTALFDGLLRTFDNNAAYTLLPISFLPIFISITVIICIHVLALGANIFLFNDKNLRKAFQRAR